MEITQRYRKFIEMCDKFDYKNAESLLKDIIVNVISRGGVRLDIERTAYSRDVFDYVGKIRNGNNVEDIVVELKISKGKLTTNQISSLLVNAMSADIKNIVLVSNNELTPQAKERASLFSSKTGINFQIFGKKGLDAWFYGYNNENHFVYEKTIHEIIKETSRQLAKMLAQKPEEFMNIEWRDLERIIATVFSDFGYDVELTPSAKDGGKDVIVWYKRESYIIEIKHWNDKKKSENIIYQIFYKLLLEKIENQGYIYLHRAYTANAFETLSKIERTRFRYGDKTSMLSLLKMYERVNSGIYVPINDLEDIIGKISKDFE